MKPTDLLITPRDPMVLRDGRPFGESGVPQAGTFHWPRPGTVIGMIRTYVGSLRDPGYFLKVDPQVYGAHVEEIRRIGMEWYLPVVQRAEKRHVCLPAPADSVPFPAEGAEGLLDIKALLPRDAAPGEGTDLPWPRWGYPQIKEDVRKPEKGAPIFWRWERMREWLIHGNLSGNGSGIDPEGLGISPTQSEERTHVCIDPETGAAAESRLFTTLGLRFAENVRLGVRVRVEEKDVLPDRDMYTLGGDRRPVFLRWGEHLLDWPSLPRGIGDGTGLRLLLITPGLFDGGWAPRWLIRSAETGKFVEMPETGIAMRLCSACVRRWEPCHGWDMTVGKKGGPKPLQKTAPAGSVYFVELEKGSDGKTAVQALWNRSLCTAKAHRNDGMGRILVGNWHR